MKKTTYILPILIAGASLFSCSDFLDRQPLSELSPGSSFGSENQLRQYTNSFYGLLPSGSDIYDERTDQIITTTFTDEQQGTRTVPVSGGGWDWGALRNINFFLENYSRGGLSETITAPYVGLAKFFRAWFYFEKVARYGDVPWYSQALEANDSTLLLKPRDSRMLIIDSVIADLDAAIASLPASQSSDRITRWTALALKSRVCLFEGTFRKYHANDDFGQDSRGNALTGAEELLALSAAAAKELMDNSPYSLYVNDPESAYHELFIAPSPINTEIILARTFSEDLQVVHNVNYYTVSPSYGKPGLEKGFVNSYLMRDGSRFTDQPGFATMQFYDEVQNRDPRLSGTIRTPGYTRVGSSVELPPDLGATVTGYQLIKYVSDPSHDKINGSVVPLPIFRYAEVLLNYAEAKAETGTITQEDLDATIGLLRTRAGMPSLDLAAANANPDPYLAGRYPHVSGPNQGVILEIRRERGIELVMEDFRWNDLMRWKAGQLLAQPFHGAYFPGPGSYDLDGDGAMDLVLFTGDRPPGNPDAQFLKLGSDITLENGADGGRVIVNANIAKTFREDRDYLYPIATQELLLNPNLVQNPNWE